MGRTFSRMLRMAAVGLSIAAASLPAGQAASAATAAPLQYQKAGAPIESSPAVYIVFWGQQWQLGWSDVSTGSMSIYKSSQAQTYITDFFKYVGSTSTAWNSSQQQYCSGVPVGTVNCGNSGTHVASSPVTFGGSWVDTTSPPPPPVVPDNCAAVVCLNTNGGAANQSNLLAQEAIRAEAHFLGATGYNPNANFMIMLPKATATPGYGVYCAYHSEVIDGNGYFDGYSIVAGHEFAEAETDPFPSAATAWLDSNGQETGDKCAWITPGTPGGAYNIGPDAGGHHFAVQSLWSNTDMACK